MISLYVDSVENCVQLVDSDVTDRAASLALPPGSYSIRIDRGGITRSDGGADPEAVVHLWVLGGRHLDRATNVATHSRFRSLCGLQDVLFLDVYEETRLYAFWFEAQEPYPMGGVTLAVQTLTVTQRLDVKAPDHCVPLPTVAVSHRAASMVLPEGTHVLGIERGEFSFFPNRKDSEPTVLLWFEGGRLRDRAAGQIIPRMVRTLNGYGNARVVDVIERTVLNAFWFDSYPADNSGNVTLAITFQCDERPKYNALLVDGRSEHPTWAKLSAMLASYLKETKLFRVSQFRAQQSKDAPVSDLEIAFSAYDVIVLNYSSLSLWPPQTRAALEIYVKGGGGLVSVHSSDNAFPNWAEYNKMIALGGWYGRDKQDGFYLFYDDAGMLHREKHPEWPAGEHPATSDYLITLRDAQHPVANGLPAQWMHAHDELYGALRGPADSVRILATGYSDPSKPQGTGRHEPLLMAIEYGQGRVFHTTLGHTNEQDGVKSAECVGFITTFQRGAEWAATGQVTQPLPGDFPTTAATSSRPFSYP